ncbi:SGNH/GDSL hydrolase family protein [Vibrio maerlii]|uniref:SGNH/GDSL hydrolase family protein n=1 Tax=Vibrio maerlii TaxID=2231648 RepID=UPI000E3D9F96|nr:SGNH/GDSL hydrolase family protein [Vibrio maerlii]
MSRDELVQVLKNNQCLDLHELYTQNPSRSMYALVNELDQLREEHNLKTKISAFNSEIDGLIQTHLSQHDWQQPIPGDVFKQIAQSLDLNQRAHKMSRFILAKNNHTHFSKQSDLVMFGDSITEWGPWHDAITDISLSNRGLAGDTTSGMIQRLETTLNCNPQLVCVMAGINDLAQGYSVDSVIKNYQTLIDTWQESGIEVWVQSTLYVGTRMAALNPKVEALNSWLNSYCEQQGHIFIDLNTSLSPEGILPLECSCDDLHLNAFAYQNWLDVLLPMLEKRFPSVEQY